LFSLPTLPVPVGSLQAAEELARSRKKCQGTTSQLGKKLEMSPILQGFVTGHDFSHADKANKITFGL
jgi:hypothetical protein